MRNCYARSVYIDSVATKTRSHDELTIRENQIKKKLRN